MGERKARLGCYINTAVYGTFLIGALYYGSQGLNWIRGVFGAGELPNPLAGLNWGGDKENSYRTQKCVADIIPIDQTGDQKIVMTSFFPTGTVVTVIYGDPGKTQTVEGATSTGINPPGYIRGDIFNPHSCDLSQQVLQELNTTLTDGIPVEIIGANGSENKFRPSYTDRTNLPKSAVLLNRQNYKPPRHAHLAYQVYGANGRQRSGSYK